MTVIDLAPYRGDAPGVEEEEFRAGLAKRLRDARLFLGYDTVAGFARAIGYPPDKYSRYERRGIERTGVLMRLVEAIRTSGHGQVSYNWLLGFSPGPIFLWRGPPWAAETPPALH